MNNSQKHLSFIETFISKYYMKQPQWVRTFTFVIFVLLLCFTISRLIGGEYNVRGRILHETENGLKPAKNYDIRVGDKYFGTNSRGLYYIILNPTQYYRLMLKGNLKLGLSKDEDIFNPKTLRYLRLDDEFEDWKLLRVQEIAQLHKNEESEIELSDVFIPLAHALDVKENYNRLFVTSLQLQSNLSDIKEGRLEFLFNGNSSKLLDAQTSRMPAGLIPIVSGEKIFLETNYYLNIPQGLKSSDIVKINLSAKKRGFLKQFSPSYSELFKVGINPNYGIPFSSIGNNGSEINLLLLSMYDLVTWEKEDLEGVIEKIEHSFRQNGFRMVKKHSPLGYKAQTNSIFGGKSVPFTIIQKVLDIVSKNQIKIKAILYKRVLRSGNPYEIQLGGYSVYDDAPPLTDEKINQLLRASTEKEFINILAHP